MANTSKHKVALITGGSKGIGFRIATILAKKKYNIVICSRNLLEAKQAQKKIAEYGISCLAVQTDVSKFNQCKLLVKKTIKKFSRIDLLVNNAGIQGPVGYLWESNLKEWEKTIQVNLFGIFYISYLVIPHMLKQKFGKIINLSGGGAAYARPLYSAYASSKTAVIRLTETLAEELKEKNITVIALAPGATWTNMAKEALQKSQKVSDQKNIQDLKVVQANGGTSYSKHEKIISYLISKKAEQLSGKLIHVNELTKILKQGRKLTKKESGLLRRINFN